MKNFNLKINKNGFALLFTIVLISIILSITIGVTNIAFRELKFATSDQDANTAFFAADTGMECAEYNDYPSASTVFYDPSGGTPTDKISCLGTTYSDKLLGSSYGGFGKGFTLKNLGNSGNSCAVVEVDKYIDSSNTLTGTKIISIGYNNSSCDYNAPNVVTREVDSTY